MKGLKINTGEIRLAINDDENRIISFNPNDLEFVERFYSLISEFEIKEQEYNKRRAELNIDQEVDSYGIPRNIKDNLELLKETGKFLRDKIDYVFGEGTSQAVFGNANTIDMFEQFFEGITPYIKKTREDKINKHTKTSKRNVMK